MLRALTTKIRKVLYEITRLNRSPKDMAKSFAVGVVIAVSPYLGLHTYMAVLVAGWLRLPVYPVVIGAHVTNVVTIPFIYTFTTRVGMWIMGLDAEIDFDWRHITLTGLFHLGKQLFLPFFLGSHIVALLSYVPAYFLSLGVFTLYRRFSKNGE